MERSRTRALLDALAVSDTSATGADGAADDDRIVDARDALGEALARLARAQEQLGLRRRAQARGLPGVRRQAGVGALGVAWGYHAPEQLRQAGAHAVAESAHVLLAAIDARLAAQEATA